MFLLRKVPFVASRFAKPQSRLSQLRRLKPLGWVGLGAAFIFLFDPDRGKGRRKKLFDMTAGRVRRGGRKIERKEYDDVTLANKVMSEVFADQDTPKGEINVSAEEGTVVLHGQVQQPEQINEIEKRVLVVQGVRGVRNELHVPETQTAGNGRGRRRS
jgi:hypothetical protein